MNFLDWIYPPRCVFCHNIIPVNVYKNLDICPKCLKYIPWYSGKNKNYLPKIFKNGWIVLDYDEMVKAAIMRFKYDNCPRYAKALAFLMYNYMKNIDFGVKIDYFIPVPIHKKRKRVRGYNQAELLAKELSKLSGIPYINNLKRIKNTKPQSKLHGVEARYNNLKNSFLLEKPEMLKDKNIMIIDDIMTTGATLEKCALSIIDKSNCNGIYYYILSSGKK